MEMFLFQILSVISALLLVRGEEYDYKISRKEDEDDDEGLIFRVVEPTEGKPRKNITLECKVEAEEIDLFDTPITWFKVDAGKRYKINDNRVIQSPFQEAGRYEIIRKKAQQPKSIEISLNITNVMTEDNGTYECQISGPTRVLDVVIRQVLVYSAIRTINFTAGNNTMPSISSKDGMVFELTEGDKVPLSCFTTGGNPPPNVHIFKNLDDISGLFNQQTNITKKGPPGRESFEYTVKRHKADFLVQHEDNGKVLKCDANVPTMPEGETTFSRTTSAKLVVRYAPKFDCKKEMTAPPGGPFRLECSVAANPPVDVDNLTWHLPGQDEPLEHGNEMNNCTANMTVTKDGKVSASLTIANVTDSSYHVYKLRAQNEVDTRIHEITLIPEAQTGGGPGDKSPSGAKTGYKTTNPSDAAPSFHSFGTSLLLVILVSLIRF